jgi:hypothetical protein
MYTSAICALSKIIEILTLPAMGKSLKIRMENPAKSNGGKRSKVVR